MPHKQQEIIRINGYAVLKTSKGEEILIDADDIELVTKFSWCVSKTGYAVANINYKVIKLHRLLLKPKSGEIIDHINGNPLDNRRINLRVCTNRQNAKNCKLGKNNTSGYTGVDKTPQGKYRARIVVDRKKINLGHYESKESAIVARMSAERDYYGDFAPVDNALKGNFYSRFLEKGRVFGVLYCGKKELTIQINEVNYQTIKNKAFMKQPAIKIKKEFERFKERVTEITNAECKNKLWTAPAGDMPVAVEIKFWGEVPKTQKQWFKAAADFGMISPVLPSNWMNLNELILDALVGVAYSSKSQIFDLKTSSAYGSEPRTEVTVTGYYQDLGAIKTAACARLKKKKEIANELRHG